LLKLMSDAVNPSEGKWKLVEQYLDYEYSSAGFYDLGEKAKCKLFHYAELISAESPTGTNLKSGLNLMWGLSG
jgi:hypothetical protein